MTRLRRRRENGSDLLKTPSPEDNLHTMCAYFHVFCDDRFYID